MQNNIKKTKIYMIITVVIAVLSIQSCTKDDSNSFKCTTYLNGNVWSEKTVSDCSICTAPQGYTTTCEEN